MMKRSKRFAALILTGVMAVTTLFGCGSSSGGAASDALCSFAAGVQEHHS